MSSFWDDILLREKNVQIIGAKSVTKIGAKSDTKPPPKSDGKTPPKLRQDSAKTPLNDGVRNRDFVDFEHFSFA